MGNSVEDQFLGVYTTNEPSSAVGDFPHPGLRRKHWWFVWQAGAEQYKVQPLNAVLQPMATPRLVTFSEFEKRYTADMECHATPVGGYDASMPGNAVYAGAGLSALHMVGSLSADDPHLLQRWLLAEPPSGREQEPGLTLPVELDGLMGDILPDSSVISVNGESNVADTRRVTIPADAAGPAMGDMAKLLRERFVRALLRLRRGERAESMAEIKALLEEQHPFFEDGAQLFSEFGLGLRRLGLVRLALQAHKRALAFEPRDERILFNIARNCHDLDLVLESREFLEQALAVAPNFAMARQFLAFLEANKKEQE